MILKRIRLKNFRQFYGEQEIEFSNESNNNITTILGENGCGKTGIYRAMIFCLYGEKNLSNEKKHLKDGKQDQVHLVNLNYLEEHKGQVCFAEVEIELSNDKKTYVITRKIAAKKSEIDDSIKENEELDVSMQIIDEKGNYSPRVITDSIEVSNIVNEMLDKGLKDFFFFDGEQIESLSKTDKEMREAIKEGITKLLQIDHLTTAINIVEKSKQAQQRVVRNSNPNSELTRLLEEIKETKNRIEEKRNEKDSKTKEYNENQKTIETIEEKRKKNSSLKQIYEKIHSIEGTRNSQNDSLKQNLGLMKDIVCLSGSSMILDDYMIKAAKTLENSMDNNISVLLPTNQLEEMLKTKRCLCCNREFHDGDISDIYIKQMLKLQEKIGNQKDISSIVNEINRARSSNDRNKKSITDYLNRIESLKSSIESFNKEIQDYKKEINSSSMKESELANLANAYAQLTAKQEGLHKDIIILDKDIADLIEGLKEKEEEYKKIEQEQKNNDKEVEKLGYLDNLCNLFTSIKEKYSKKMREKLSNEATQNFRELIADKDKNLINRIEIGDNYEIIVKGWDNTSILQDISSGQRQIVSLAVIVGLAQIACNNDINIPLFMDTPFGRVSSENRSNTISCLSKKVGQWILLVTDTEMTEFEYNELLKTKKWGKFYILDDKDNKGKTIITEKDKQLYDPRKEV